MFRHADVVCLCLVFILWQFSMLHGMTFGLLMLVEDERGDHEEEAQYDTSYKWLSCHIGYKLLWKMWRNLPPQQWGPDLPFFTSQPCGIAGWLALLLIKSGDVETNPGLTNTHKQVWICAISHKQIHTST